MVPQSPEQNASTSHCVLVCGAGGGAGASSIAVALAVYLGQRRTRSRRRICLVDLDLGAPSLAMLTNTRLSAGNPPRRESARPELVARHILSVPDLGIDLLGPLAWPPETGKLTGDMVAEVLRALAASHDVVIVDGGRLTWTAVGIQRAMVDAASQVVLVAQPALGSVAGLAWSRELLCGQHGFAVPAAHVGIVWNKVRSDLGLDLAEAAGRIGLAALQHIPDIGDAHTRAVNAGEFPLLLRRRPDWAAHIHLLIEVRLGPGVVEPLTAEVAELLPTLHRDGQPRIATRVRRTLLGRVATTPVPNRACPAWA